jgi:group I intron endonuclease
MKTSGIYKIQSKIKPERCYIGSTINIIKRWREHRYGLQNNNHDNSRLQRHYNKYGIDDLEFSILFECEELLLIQNEQRLMDLHKPYFNISHTAGRTTGYRHTTEMKEWFSKVRKGKKFTEKQKINMGLSRIGHIMSEESKLKSSITHTGMMHTEETKKKFSELRKGKKLSEEHRQKIIKGLTGRIPTVETRKKISETNKGHIVSEDTRRKISETKKLSKNKSI